jgi:hypothetical protein
MEIMKDSLPKIIRDFFKKIPDSGIQSIPDAIERSVIVDNIYSTTNQTELLGIISANPLLVPHDQMSANIELLDCDDYALQLKASITALYRQKMVATNSPIYPPAVGIVITQNHALNLMISETETGSREVYLIDPSSDSPTFINDPEQSAQALKMLPIKMIYI